ncbi:MAG: uroporphyrinogen-III C-methyltransferase [Pseudomonadota bacterium]
MTEQTTPPVSPRHALHVNWGVVLAVVAIALAAASWLNIQRHFVDVKTDMARKLAEFDASIQESRVLARNADELMRQNLARIAQLEAQQAGSREQQQALENLYKELARDRDLWTLSDIEQIVLTASQQLQLAGNVKAAIIALETADQRLLRLDKPQFTRLRQAIANDLARLRATPFVDQTGISLRLNALAENIGQWPLASTHTKKPAREKNVKPSLTRDLIAEFKNLVQIRRLDQGEPALLTPEQEYFLRENLKLRLLSARLALFSRDAGAYRADLDAAGKLLARYFNTEDAAVAAAQAELRKLAMQNVVPRLPELKESLAALESYHSVKP